MSKFKADLGNNEKEYDTGDTLYDAEVAVPAPAQS